jgi:flavorubredoxin
MQSKVTEIAPGTYRISTFHPDFKIQFNQFLIKDDEPFLMHTGFKRMFQYTLEGVATIMDPAKLRWIGFSHFESDECGALNQWLETAPRARCLMAKSCRLASTIFDLFRPRMCPTHGMRVCFSTRRNGRFCARIFSSSPAIRSR